MRCFELVVFDWDGTLADSTGVIVTSLLNAFADLALPVPAVERARHVIGLGMADALAYMAPGLATSDYSRLADRYRWHFLKQKTELYPGTEKLLRGLRDRGYRLAVATGKSKRGLERSLSELALLQYFDGWRCADMCAPKPAPDMLNELIEEFDVSAAGTLMIGDTTHDLQMAANASVAAVAVCHGAHTRSVLEAMQPMACVDSTAELATWLASNA